MTGPAVWHGLTFCSVVHRHRPDRSLESRTVCSSAGLADRKGQSWLSTSRELVRTAATSSYGRCMPAMA